MKSTTQAQLFALSDMVMGNKPMAVRLNENETITELRRQLACTQDALKTVIAENNKTISEKNATLVRQEKEIQSLNASVTERMREVRIALDDSYNVRTELERKMKLVEKWKAIAKAQEKLIADLKQSPKSAGAMPIEVWRRLLQLCHPDKHANADAATAATQWLNANKPA